TEDIAGSLERRTDRRKILAVVRSERAADILKSDDTRRPSFGDQVLHQTPEWPEGAGSIALQSGASAGERKVLAGERSPSEIDVSGQILGREGVDIGRLENSVAPVAAIDGALLGIEIVREATAPFRAETGANHAAPGEEFEEI